MRHLIKIDPRHYAWLEQGDQCWYCGEYTSGGGWGISETNRQILNLKKGPGSKANELHYKGVAVNYWGDALARLITLEKTIGKCTFVPMPGSKPIGHPEHDDRIGKVLARMAAHRPGVDVRHILKQGSARPAQHAGGGRKSPTEICETLQVDYSLMPPPLSPTIFVVDDVITMGASFAAAKRMLRELPNVEQVVGVFLAKTVWPTPGC
ncbi:phosphoribosyltransferase [Stenotrophomonas maltophilia]|uniref:phosphoribosyltransferase n=1 Tax=Stenotrophomonas maltophilia TaxID=40324 RepID=UPI00066DA698|nr:phosphoribosyltransferase [Stenotrophomonas maltophilia]MBH1783766.1 phosphoribosyltransferase [Stenotrophomonas maltophilia]MBN5048233.1 phosphoribosyltransferase [Stenotrophomonas maltophilia]HEL3210264.1 phosphoribosyltransferase [Stenotrophomonas maltophilia]HEL3769858.1 phosphoribosyltransferase [Stenotrophomonas maltophilia]HEL4185876.1 phosphoribosyltransferase [Stenotrophomonas maltophilia]